MSDASRSGGVSRGWPLYALMIAGSVVGFFLIRWLGRGLSPPTDAGIHAIFGAFLLGTLVPSGSRIARELTSRLEDIVVVLFLPAFFAFTGMRTRIDLVSGLEGWLLCGLIVLVATVGKLGGSALAARLTGMGWRDAAALGVLMNTRGLMELIVLNIGLDLGVISPTSFAMLVIMALVTTLATTPALHALQPQGVPDGAMAGQPA